MAGVGPSTASRWARLRSAGHSLRDQLSEQLGHLIGVAVRWQGGDDRCPSHHRTSGARG